MRRMRRAVLSAALLSAGGVSGLGYAQAPDRPLAVVAEFDGIIHPNFR